jgi:phosphate transport system substrate-binding protein
MIKPANNDLKAPDDPFRIRLSHTDPLDLPVGNFVISGSDTLSPVTQQIATNFHNEGYIGTFRLSQSSTGKGMEAMCQGESIDIINASRRIKSKEKHMCDENNITPIMIKVGYDPFVFITHQDNTWLKGIQKDNLKTLFATRNWSQFDSDFPDKSISFYMPRKNGGAMATMTKFIYDDSQAENIRTIEKAQYYPYNLELTRDLTKDPTSLGFASFGKLLKLKQLRVNIIPVDGARPVSSGDKYPIKRSLYLVTNSKAIKKPEVQTFIAYYLNHAHTIMPALGFSPLEGQDARMELRTFIDSLNLLMPEKNTVFMKR